MSLGGNLMATPEIEKKLFADLAVGYGKSTTASNKSIAAAYKAASDALLIAPPVVTPPPVVVPPVVVTPTGAVLAKDVGPRKALPALTQGDWNSTKHGEIIDGLNVSGKIKIHHNNVTIRNFSAAGATQDPGMSGVFLEYGKIDGKNLIENGFEWNNSTIRYVEFTGTVDAIKAMGNVTAEYNWIHDGHFYTGPEAGAGGYSHNDAVQISSGVAIVLRGNRVENWQGNAGFFADSDQGVISNVLIEKNYFNNVGNYSVYVKGSANANAVQYGLPKNVTIRDNVFGKRRDDVPANWGRMAAEIHADGLVWTNNLDETTGKLLVLDSGGKAN